MDEQRKSIEIGNPTFLNKSLRGEILTSMNIKVQGNLVKSGFMGNLRTKVPKMKSAQT